MRRTLVTLALALMIGGVAEAQQPVSNVADLWTRLRSGDTVYVTEATGQETTGVFAKASDAFVTVMVDGALRDIPSADIREIAKRGDRLWNGFLIGAGVGATIGAVAFSSCDDIYEGECDHPAAAAVGLGLFYGGVGALIDHFVKGRTVVYRVPGTTARMRPALGVGPREIRLSIAIGR
jgi:hypothetical protein